MSKGNAKKCLNIPNNIKKNIEKFNINTGGSIE